VLLFRIVSGAISSELALPFFYLSVSKQIQIDERFILKVHRNTTDYSYFVDVSVSLIETET